MSSPNLVSGVLKGLGDVTGNLHKSFEPYDTDGARPVPGPLTRHIDDLAQIAERGSAFTPADLPAYVDAVKNLNGVGLDDRKLLLEKLVTLMSRLPDGNLFGKKLQDFFIDTLYNDLPHPPAGYLSLPAAGYGATALPPQRVPYAYRSADGSNYNPLFPDMGKAGTPYARSVPSKITVPRSALPDPGLVFDTLLARQKFTPHPGGISSLFFALANLIIHSCFHTNARDWTINDASSYLDLSPLYGSSDAELDQIRTHDGSGRIHPDTFMDSRILFMPPSTNALLVLFNRNHNWIASKILAIDEWGKYAPPASLADAAAAAKREAQDAEIFHRARLVNTGFFMQAILRDYVGAILGCVRDGSAWRLDPLAAFRDLSHEVSPRGEGNVVSLEFNLLYRWHATSSAQDTQWTEAEFGKLFDGKDFRTITVDDFRRAAMTKLDPRKLPPFTEWTFNGLERGADGRFADDDLAKILQDATEWPAGAFGAQGIPDVLRVVEMLGIAQSRTWGACSMNEFREFMGLKPYSTFAEWNPDPAVHKAAEALYHHIDNLELHVGIQAEQTKDPMPGAGLCPGYTISRAILSDAVCLTRGDRFLTVDFTPFNLTSWGYQHCQADGDDGSYGGTLAKMLFALLPEHYPAGSAYGHFPFMVPETMRGFMKDRNDPDVDKYTWSRPSVPVPTAVVDTYDGAKLVLGNPRLFASTYERHLFNVAGTSSEAAALVNSVLTSDDMTQQWKRSAYVTAVSLIQRKTFEQVKSTARYVDVVKDVINLVPVHLIANELVGLPMKTEDNPHGVYREDQLYDQFAEVCNYVFVDADNFVDWRLREHSIATLKDVLDYAKGHFTKLTKGLLSFGGLSDTVVQYVAGRNDNSERFLRKLLDGRRGLSDDSLAAGLASIVATAAHFSAALANVVDFYLDDGQREARDDIVRLANVHSVQADHQLLQYALEALRLKPAVAAVYRTASANGQVGTTSVQPGQKVFVNVTKANQEASHGQEPGIFDVGEHGFMSQKFFEVAAPSVLRAVFRLPQLKRAPGLSGVLNSFTETVYDTQITSYINSKGETTPFPPSLVVHYSL